MNILLWVLQVLLSFFFCSMESTISLCHPICHPQMAWMYDLSGNCTSARNS